MSQMRIENDEGNKTVRKGKKIIAGKVLGDERE